MTGTPSAAESSTDRTGPSGTFHRGEPATGTASAGPGDAIAAALERAIGALRSLQREDGHWCAELQGDSILQSEYILMKWILGQERQPLADGRPASTLLRIVNQLRAQQRPDGGWGQYPGSGVDLSATVKAYFVLKLYGDDPEAPHMRSAREIVLRMGGAERCNSFSKFYLACLGQISWNAVPAIPPELVYLPKWFYFHMDKMSAWSRTMILPLALVVTLRPTRRLPTELSIDELYLNLRDRHRLLMRSDVPLRWRRFFGVIDATLKALHGLGGSPLRGRAIARSLKWILARMGQDAPAPTEGLGAIFPPMVYAQIVFKALGWDRSNPIWRRAELELDAFMIEEGDRIRLQPCFSPVWDTGIALYALADAGLSVGDASVRRAAEWLVGRECRHRGDWAANLPAGVEPSGWWFEYRNAWYPDVDDTAMVAMALRRSEHPEGKAAAERGVRWILAMQNDDGGWAAFDKTRDRRIYEYVPFADHNAIQDPSCPDITGRVLECLSWHGYRLDHPAVARAINYIRSHQERDGCWFGRWGVNYIYGTWQSVIGPIRCGVSRHEEWIARAGRWIKSVQKPDGSFGESANSYEDASLKGQGPSTASQTAWAAMVLQEIYGPDDPDLRRALEWLARTQLTPEQAADRGANPDGDPPGSWCELEFTGTGFPRVFYLRYHLYRLYFPLMALARGVRGRSQKGVDAVNETRSPVTG
ncbi:MAG: squalene--hopene cyclase [Phycisphaeraceae bacterium]|nr:squalene--hopene cyclase [Phycisphaeraceae bacterium]